MTDRPFLTADMPHPQQPVGWDGSGVARFKDNAIVRLLLDECTRLGGTDLNQIAIGVALGRFTVQDQIQLVQIIGYSVSGFGDLDYPPVKMVRRCDAQVRKLPA